jgi:hypothetical protein
VFYFAQNDTTCFMKYDLRTDEATLVHDFKVDFPDMKWLYLSEYEDCSADGRYWGFAIMEGKLRDEKGKAIAVVIYDRKEDRIVGKHPADMGNALRISPSGKRVVYGTKSFKADFTDPVDVNAIGHSDMALDCNGREVIVGYPLKGPGEDFLVAQDLITGKRVKLLSVIHGCKDWEDYKRCSGTGMHTSGNCYATPGWAVVSTYGHKKEKDIWSSHVIYLIKLAEGDAAKPVVWRVAHAHSVYDPANQKHYFAETHASIDRWGRTINFASNWDDPQAPIEAYRVDLPAGWYEKIMGEDAARETRKKAAETLGITVEELTGRYRESGR